MEKMISVINDNLNSVVSGIKDHKASTEELLATIKNEMDKKVDIAQEYKNNVEDAKAKIARSEAEIKDLEKDLEDLNQKFDGKDFREILNAGNKEINSKIIEKRKAISIQGKRILDVTDKAHDLKEELVDLKNRRDAAEEDLVKTNTLLNYYETNIANMIDFTTYHVDELEGYSVPNYDEDEIEDVDINKIADGKIFEEIADLSNTEPDAKLVEKALNNKEEFDSEFAELLNEENKVNSDTMTDTLESIISTGKDIISSGKYVGMMDYIDDTNSVEPTETVIDEEIEEEPTYNTQEIEISSDVFEEEPENEESDEKHGSDVAGEMVGSSVEGETVETEEEPTEENDEIESPEDINFDDFLISFDDVNEELKLDENEEEPTEENEDEEVEEETTEEESEEQTDEENMDKYFNDDFTVPGFEDEYEDSYPEEEKSTSEIIPIEEDLGSDNKEIVTNLLLKTSVTPEEIEKYVKDFTEIDTDRLKREIENDKDREMADILVSAMPLKEDVIQEVIGLTDEQNKVLKKAAGRRYITINAFPELVKDNFDTIKNLGVKDPIGIFINHPTRFTMNPTNFKDVLDKYDEEDLIRCLDKNGAVIDKL